MTAGLLTKSRKNNKNILIILWRAVHRWNGFQLRATSSYLMALMCTHIAVEVFSFEQIVW